VNTTDVRSDALVVALFRVARRLKTMRSTLQVETGALPLLGVLMDQDGQRLSDIAATACLDVSTASRHVRALEEAGLVQRTTDPDDRRASRLSLTTEGRESLRRAHDARKLLVDDALQGWSAKDREALTRLLQRLADDLNAIHETTDHKTTTEATTSR
jgi:DNA-binding MarR family transcriptional regulator